MEQQNQIVEFPIIMAPELWTAGQAAEYLQVHKGTIQNWSYQGRLSRVSINGSRKLVRYIRSEVEDLAQVFAPRIDVE